MTTEPVTTEPVTTEPATAEPKQLTEAAREAVLAHVRHWYAQDKESWLLRGPGW